MGNVARLAELLDELEKLVPIDELIEAEDGEYYYYPDHFDVPRWEEVRSEAEDLCFTTVTDSEGHPNSDNRRELEELGFGTYAGDEDSFGWLVGCITKHHRIMTFG